jgi:glyoxylase I family protein
VSEAARYRNLVIRREKWAKQCGRGVSCARRSITGISRNGIWEAIMFKRIDHIEIVTDQLDRTVQFYTEVLGFTVKALDRIESSGLGVPINLVYLDLGGTVVELISYEGAAVDPAPQTEHLGYRMIALEVDDMQKTADYLRTSQKYLKFSDQAIWLSLSVG